MKQFFKYLGVGIVGYFVGFYELKYRIMKDLLLKSMDEDEES